jgi:hypothetical protein
MEELFLGPLLAGEELDVVDQQRIERAVRLLEFRDRVVLQGPHHVADESFAVDVGDPSVGTSQTEHVANGVHEVRLAKADATIDEQRVIGAAGIFRDLDGGGAGELVALALDERVEGEFRVDAAADNGGRQAWR